MKSHGEEMATSRNEFSSVFQAGAERSVGNAHGSRCPSGSDPERVKLSSTLSGSGYSNDVVPWALPTAIYFVPSGDS